MILLWFPIIDESEDLFMKKTTPKVRREVEQKLEKSGISTRPTYGSESVYSKEGVMEEIFEGERRIRRTGIP